MHWKPHEVLEMLIECFLHCKKEEQELNDESNVQLSGKEQEERQEKLED